MALTMIDSMKETTASASETDCGLNVIEWLARPIFPSEWQQEHVWTIRCWVLEWTQKWDVEETRAFLELKLEASRAAKGEDWGFISEALRERHEFYGGSGRCEAQWDTLCEDLSTILSSALFSPQRSEWVSSWEMDEDKRPRNKLPQVFPMKWFTIMAMIFAAQEQQRSGTRKSRGAAEAMCFNKVASLMKVLAVSPAGGGQNQDTLLHTATTLASSTKASQTSVEFKDDIVSDATATNLHIMCPDHEQMINRGLVPSEMKPTSLTDLSRSNHYPQVTVMSMLAAYFKQRIEDALEPIVGPVAAACQSQWGSRTMKAEQRKKFLALEEKKLALRHEKIQRLKRCLAAGRFQRRPHRRSASSARALRPRVRKGRSSQLGHFV